MISTLIVEDEQAAAVRLAELIHTRPELKLLGVCASGREAATEIDRLKPRLVFLDVYLPDISGLDVLKILYFQPLIIFTTAYNRFAVDAFELNAVDFLLKPFSAERFNKAVHKALRQLGSGGQLPALQAYRPIPLLHPEPDFLTRIPSKVGEKIFILNTHHIVYFQSKEKMVLAFRKDDYFIVNYTLEELQNRLDPEQFFRIHRSTIVNINFVESIEPLFGGTYLMRMRDVQHSALSVSRNAGRQIRKKLGW